MNIQQNLRPTCEEWLKQRNNWVEDYQSVHGEIKTIMAGNDMVYDIKSQFVNHFLKEKYVHNN